MADDLSLTKPTALDGHVWFSVDRHRQRLVRAVEAGDRPLILGCCKDLAESVAKAVADARGGTIGAKEKFPAVLVAAHKALDRQPGHGVATDPPLRDVAQGAMTVVGQLAPLGNELGTGHGRISAPAVEEEVVEVALGATMLWCRGVLRRLGPLIEGDLPPLLNDLRHGIWHAGELTRRLVAANLPATEEPDLRRLGAAVGRRAASGTFVVAGDGVDACANSDDLVAWPPAYRVGVAEGLLLDPDGYLHADATDVERAVRVLSAMPDVAAAIAGLVRAVSTAAPSARLAGNAQLASSVVSAVRASAGLLPESARANWRQISRPLEPF